MKRIHFTQEQVSKILEDFAQKEGGYQELLKISLEAIMRAEREEHNQEHDDMSNGYRLRKTFGQGKILELKVPRSRKGYFYPLLLGLLKDQEEEARKLAFSLYGSGLTTEQVGNIFEEVYGRHYSTSQVSRMFSFARSEVKAWLERPLLPYYPILFIDATFIYTRRHNQVSKEAYYTILGVKKDRTREVLAIVNFPTESALAWEEVFMQLKERGLKEVGLTVSDNLTSIDTAIWKHFPQTAVQQCVIHLERNVQKHVKVQDKAELLSDFKEVFRTGDRYDNKDKGWERWIHFCNKWSRHYPSFKRYQNTRYKLYFTYLNYDYRIHNMIYSTNWIERLNRDYKRTIRMRGALPNPESVLLLLGYVAMTRNAYQRKIPKINYETKLLQWDE